MLADLQHCTYYISVHVCMQCCKVINLIRNGAYMGYERFISQRYLKQYIMAIVVYSSPMDISVRWFVVWTIHCNKSKENGYLYTIGASWMHVWYNQHLLPGRRRVDLPAPWLVIISVLVCILYLGPVRCHIFCHTTMCKSCVCYQAQSYGILPWDIQFDTIVKLLYIRRHAQLAKM